MAASRRSTHVASPAMPTPPSLPTPPNGSGVPSPVPTPSPSRDATGGRRGAKPSRRADGPSDGRGRRGEHPADDSRTLSVTVAYGKRSARLGVDGSLPVAEIVPDIAKRLGVLDPTLVYAGYRLLRADGTAFGNSSSLAEQAVRDGDRLTLEVGALENRDVVYDDIVEAVADSVERTHRPWTSANTTLTSLVVSCALLSIGALCTALAPASPLNAGVAGFMAAALLAICTVLSGRSMTSQALALAMVACAFAGVAGYHVMGSLLGGPFHAFPALGVGVGLLVSGGIVCLVLTKDRLHALIPIILGVVLSAVGGLCVGLPQWATRIWIIAIALVGLAANALPWLSLSSARLSVDSPASEAEIFALPKAIDIGEVRGRYRTGSTLLFDLRAAAGAIVVIGTPIAVSGDSPAGVALTLALFAAMLLDSRRIYAQSEMLVTVVFAGLGICLSCAACAAAHPAWTTVVIALFALGALLCVIATQVARRDSIAMVRLADAADVACVAATLPLAYLALGL